MQQSLVTYPGLTLDRLQEELTATPAGRRSVRLLALVGIMEGRPTQEVADFLQYERHAITDWVARVNEEGLAGLDDKPGRGRKARLTDDQRVTLREHLQQSPRTHGLQTNLWTGPVLREHIRRQFGITYGLTRLYVILEELGFTLQRPTSQYLGAKPERQADFRRVVKKNPGRGQTEFQAGRAR